MKKGQTKYTYSQLDPKEGRGRMDGWLIAFIAYVKYIIQKVILFLLSCEIDFFLLLSFSRGQILKKNTCMTNIFTFKTQYSSRTKIYVLSIVEKILSRSTKF